MRKAFILVWFLAVAFSSCEPSGDFVSNARGAEYFPLEIGSYSLYDVDSIAIVSNVESRYQYELRLEIREDFENAAGGKSFVIQRLKRKDPSEAWVPLGSWTAWTDARSAVMVEGNQKFVRLRFPIQVGNEWNGNELNSQGGDEDCNGRACDLYEVSEVDPDVLVIQSNIPDVLVKFDVRKEVYTRDVGLSYKEITVLEYCTTQSCFGKQFVDKGLKYKQTLIEHGKI